MIVGFLGLGSMGAAMAQNILKAGMTLHVWNRSVEKTEPLAKAGAVVAREPRDLAACDVVLAMLANDEATEASIVGSGLLAALPKTATFVNCATISLGLARELTNAFGEAGVAYVAAPVLGRPVAAAAAQLNIIAAGSDENIARVQPIFDAIGQKTYRMGTDPVQANVAKIGANYLIASAIAAMSEAFAIASANDLDPHALYDLVTNTIFAAPVYKGYGEQIIERKFEPAGFALRLGRKDVGLAESAGRGAGLDLPIAHRLGELFDSAIAAGDGDKDWSSVSLQIKQKVATN